jgi:hypothetical protein
MQSVPVGQRESSTISRNFILIPARGTDFSVCSNTDTVECRLLAELAGAFAVNIVNKRNNAKPRMENSLVNS